jgi:non-lysosomal glucosylceramidase
MGRSPRGDFNLWHLDGGEHVLPAFPACQFSLFEQHRQLVNPRPLPSAPSLRQMAVCPRGQWYPPTVGEPGHEANGASDKTAPAAPHPPISTGTYSALYPRSWYLQNVFQAEMTCEQFSPIWPDNYQEASYPVAVFEWTAHNPTDQPLTLSMMVSWQNMVGWFTNTRKSPEVMLRDDGSPYYDYVPALGQSQGNTIAWCLPRAMMGCDGRRWWQQREAPRRGTASGAGHPNNPTLEVSYDLRWNPTGDGRDLWDTFASHGTVDEPDGYHPG